MYFFKTNPKNKRYWFISLCLYIISIFSLSYHTIDKLEVGLTSLLFVGLSLFFYLEGKASFTITKDNHIYSYFGKKTYSKTKYKLRADGYITTGFRGKSTSFYRLRVIHRDTYETEQEIKMSMTSKEYYERYLDLEQLGEFK